MINSASPVSPNHLKLLHRSFLEVINLGQYPSGIRPLKIHSDFEKAPEKAPRITFKITSNVQFWGAFRRLKDRITSKLPSEGPSNAPQNVKKKVIWKWFQGPSQYISRGIWKWFEGPYSTLIILTKKKEYSLLIPVCAWRASVRREMRIDTEKGTKKRPGFELTNKDKRTKRFTDYTTRTSL